MFKRVIIELTGPICNCPSENLSWGFGCDRDGKLEMTLECLTCHGKLVVPEEKLGALFRLDVRYPVDQTPAVQGIPAKAEGKVIQLFPKKEG
ncbi:MAG: hypothetical protein RLZZ324_270 [Candidatus Parcubacteria bacterium]|jgi:hypothetical protein